MSQPKYQFLIEDIGVKTTAWASSLTITKNGWVKLWHGRRLVGVARAGDWRRITVFAVAPKQEKAR